MAAEELERVDPRRVAVAPVNLEPIGADEGEMHGTDIRSHGHGIKQGPARHLIDALGTRAGQPKLPRGKPDRGATGDPLEQDPIVAPSNCGRDRRRSARTTLLGYLSVHWIAERTGRLHYPQRTNDTARFPL